MLEMTGLSPCRVVGGDGMRARWAVGRRKEAVAEGRPSGANAWRSWQLKA